MTNKKPDRFICDYETGSDAGELYPGDRIVRKQSADYLQRTVELMSNEPYTKVYNRPMFSLAKSLTGSEMQMVYFLLPFLSFESGMLTTRNGQPLTRKQIADRTGLSINTVDRLLQGLKEKQVIGKHMIGREVQYFMNPYLFMRGKRINKTLHDMFQNTVWAKEYENKPNK